MAFRSFKKELDKVYLKIDKIAKVGRDNFQEYYNYVDDLIFKQQYGILTQVLYIKYDFDYTKYLSVNDVKQKSWSQICFRTNTKFQDEKYRLLKDNNVYQVGFSFYRQNPITSVVVMDPGIGLTAGYGAELKPVIANDSNRGIVRIEVLSPGRNYSTASYVSVRGGNPSAEAVPVIRGVGGYGSVLTVNITATGSHHNQDTYLGDVREYNRYVISIDPLAYTDDPFQTGTDNKVSYLVVDKVGVTMSATFSDWNFDLSYDKNLINLYREVMDYLI